MSNARARKYSEVPLERVKISLDPEVRESLRTLRTAIDRKEGHDFDPDIKEMLDLLIVGNTTNPKAVIGEMALVASESARVAEKYQAREIKDALNQAMFSVLGDIGQQPPPITVSINPRSRGVHEL